MKHVIFVDDEPNILQGLRRMLRPLRHEWEMTFASDGHEALQRLDEAPCDVLVSDVRMPGMSGVELIERVREHHPDVVRIMLSGQADRASTFAAVGSAHQYLNKPCDAETIKTTVDRALTLRRRISSDAIASLVANVDALPTVPEVYLDLKKELAEPEASAGAVAEIIARDPAMTAKILQVVNSAFFGFRREIQSPQDAVQLLGFELVHSLALSASLFGRVADPALAPLVEQQWRHSFLTASMAKQIARSERVESAVTNTIVTAALLHDVGKLVLASSAGGDYLALLREARDQVAPLWELEAEAFGASHADVGGYLLALWALPDPIVEAVTYHHAPTDLPSTGVTPLAVVHVADSLAHELTEADGSTAPGRIDEAYLDAAGVRDRFDAWTEACRDVVERG